VSRASLANALAVVAALAASVALAARPRAGSRGPGAETRSEEAPRELEDATGTRVTVRDHHRIASGSPVADRLLVDLCEPDRVIAFSARSALAIDAHRYAGRATIETIEDTERVASLRPDLLLVHNVAEARRVERLREAGLTVFDLGPMEGMATLPEDIRVVAALCGAPERGDHYLAVLERRLAAVARDVPESARREAIYLSIYGDRLFGGTVGTSYHDVLLAAGLRDAASARHRGWPQYTVEQLLSLDPEVIVTREGMRPSICDPPGLHDLSACAHDGVVEIDGDLLDSAGPGMLEAAEAVHDAVYR
jgi:iron complex transport system substrate-binding protein